MHWLSIQQRIFFKLLLLVHKFFIGLAPQYFCEILLVKCETERLLYLKFMNTTSGKRSFEYAACRLWNRLPLHVRTLNDSEQFKNNIKTILFANTNNINDTFTLYNWFDLTYTFDSLIFKLVPHLCYVALLSTSPTKPFSFVKVLVSGA